MSHPISPLRTLTELDHVRLYKLLSRESATASALAELLDQADLVPSVQIPPDVATMNSRLQLADPRSGRTREITLCYPGEADAAAGRLSVLSPAGAALLGLPVGSHAEWRGADGLPVVAQLQAILYQPEASGDLLR